MKKLIQISTIIVVYSLQIFVLKGQNTYDPYDLCTNTPRGIPIMSYTGEYQIFFAPNSYYFTNFQANAITYKIENVSFPFTTNCLNCSNPQSPYYSNTTRILKMPNNDFTYDPIGKKWIRNNANLPGGPDTVVGYDYSFRLRNSYTANFHTGTVNNLTFKNEPSDLVSVCFKSNSPTVAGYSFEYGNGQIIYPHSILKHTFYFHCGPYDTDAIVDSMSFILDLTRGRMRNYPFLNHNNGLNNGNASTISNHDIAVVVDLIPGENSVDDNYDNTFDVFTNCFSLTYPTINYFPFLMSDHRCSNHIPPAPMFPGIYLRPPTYSRIQAYLGNDHAVDEAGTILPTNTTEYGIKQEYVIDRPIDLTIINPEEKIIYNPSEVKIDLAQTGANQELLFPDGYKFKTVSGRYPSRTETFASDPDNLHSHPEEIDVKTTLDPSCDSVGAINDGIFAYYYVKSGSTLRIGNCVGLYDLDITVEPGATLKYNSTTVSGNNFNIHSTGGTIIDNAPSVPVYSDCPLNCYVSNKYDYINNLVVISQNETWNASSIAALDHTYDGKLQVGGTMRIEAGNTLTINGPFKIEFGENGKIVVERGAKLIVNGTATDPVEFTSAEFCKKGMWAGMEVWGKRADDNQNSAEQGLIRLTYAKISNARNGIITDNSSANPSGWDYAGGVIKCDYVQFLNNRKSVAFISYHNRGTNSPEINNFSYFRHCSFKVDNYLNDLQYKTADGRPFAGDAQVSMWDVRNVLFENCEFENSVSHQSSATSPWFDSDTRGTAIYTIDAGVRLLGGSSIGNGHYYTENTFKGFSDAVRCINTTYQDAMDFIWIDKNRFIDNVHGVTLEGTSYAQVNRNHFEVPAHEANSYLDYDMSLSRGFNKPTGLYMIGSTDFVVQENEFYESGAINSATASESDKFNYGIVVNNSTGSTQYDVLDGTGAAYVYKNKFKNMSVSLQAELDNRGDNYNYQNNWFFTGAGLEYKCNEFNARNLYDVTVPDKTNAQDFSSIRNQGLCITSHPEREAGNIFNSCSGGEELYFGSNSDYNNSFRHSSSNDFIYRDQANQFTCTNLNPTSSFYYDPTIHPIVPCPITIGANTCPSNYTIANNISLIRNNYYSAQAMAATSSNTFRSLFDGGNSAGLLAQTYTETDAGALKSLLLSKSPYLSDTVMIAAINKQDTMPAKDIKAIVIANSPVTTNVMKAIGSRAYLSKIIDSVALYQTGVSARREKENEADYYASQAKIATIQLKQAYMEVDNLDSLAKVSQKDSSLMGKFNLIHVYVTDRDYANAHTILNEIFTKEGTNLSDKTKLNAMSLVLAQQGKSWFDLPDSLMQVVKQIYYNHPETAINARAILALTKGLQYDRYPFDLAGGKEKRMQQLPSKPNIEKPKVLKVLPNPANDNFKAEFSSSNENSNNKFIIYNSLGGKEKEIELQPKQIELFLNGKDFAQGVYLIMLISDLTIHLFHW